MSFQLNSPLDMHLHFREGAMLDLVAPLSAHSFSGGVVMPNLVPPVDDVHRLDAYERQVRAATSPLGFEPYMTLFMRPYTSEELSELRDRIIGVKLYPAGITTHSDQGVKNMDDVADTLRMMEEMEIPLLVHGETQGFVLDREVEFLSTYEQLASRYSKLKIVMEHITTLDALRLLDRYDNLYATVTLQHLMITLDDIAGGLMNPHLFCKPIAKRPEDRDALLSAALAPHPKLMFGSDSAPHPRDKKECCGCAAGVFTAPVALQILVELFAKHNALDALQAFTSDNARRIYGVNPPKKVVEFDNCGDVIPERYGDVIPIFAGQSTSYAITRVDTEL